MEGYETLAYALVQDGRFELTVLADVVDAQSSVPAIVILLLLILGVFFGMLTSAVALWRSGAVPCAAVLMILAFLVVDLFLNEGFGIAPAWASHVFDFVGACWIASAAVLLAGRAGLSDEALRRASLGQQCRGSG